MPYLKKSSYRSPALFKNGHFSTLFSGRIKKTFPPAYQRETWELDDGDFLLVDYIIEDPDHALILCHGLEGNSHSSYMNTSADYFLQENYSVFAWNNRSCGGEMNRLSQLYHHASVEDLDIVVRTISDRGFKNIYLLGYSLGGAQILSYMGRGCIPDTVKAGVAVSTPIQLKSSAQTINKGLSRVYARWFIKSYKAKIQVKAETYPDLLDANQVKDISTFEDIAESFMVPVHGFKDLEDYFRRASPGYSIDRIRLPVLVLNAWDDPMLGEEDYPIEVAKNHPCFFLETPTHGGHCAFIMRQSYHSYAEQRAYEFFINLC